MTITESSMNTCGHRHGRRRAWSAIAVVAALCVGCGGDDDASPSPDDLEQSLLSTSDLTDSGLGDGWIDQSRDTFTDRSMPALTDTMAWCDEAADTDRIEELAGNDGAMAEMRQPSPERRSFHGVTEQLWAADTATDFVDTVTAAYEACLGRTWQMPNPESDDSTDVVDVMVNELPGPSVGDDSVSMRIEIITPGPDGDYRWSSRTLIARTGNTVMVLRELDVQIDGSEPFASDDDWADLVTTAADTADL